MLETVAFHIFRQVNQCRSAGFLFAKNMVGQMQAMFADQVKGLNIASLDFRGVKGEQPVDEFTDCSMLVLRENCLRIDLTNQRDSTTGFFDSVSKAGDAIVVRIVEEQ